MRKWTAVRAAIVGWIVLGVAGCGSSGSPGNSAFALPDVAAQEPDGAGDAAKGNGSGAQDGSNGAEVGVAVDAAAVDVAQLSDAVQTDASPVDSTLPAGDAVGGADANSGPEAGPAQDAELVQDAAPAQEAGSAADVGSAADAAVVDAAPPDVEPPDTAAPDASAPDVAVADTAPPGDAQVDAQPIGVGQSPPGAGVYPYLGCQAGGPAAQFVAEGPPPPSLKVGQTAAVWVAFANCGSQAWIAKPALGPTGHKVGAQAPQDNKNWGFDRVALPGDVAPNQVVRVDFNVTAPAVGGATGYQWQIVNEGVVWIDGPSPLHSVDVQGGDPPPPPPGSVATLADLWSGAAHFVVDQEPVPLSGVNSGHREAFAVNRTDLGPKTVYMYHRCFGQSAAVASICLSVSSDGVDSFSEFVGEIVAPDPGHIFCVAPSVAQVGGQWVMVYEESNVATAYWAQSGDGKQWSKKGALLPKPAGAWDSGAISTPSILVGADNKVHVFYAGMVTGGTSMSIGRADGVDVGSLAKFVNPVMVPPGAGWNGGQLSMPRVVFQNGWYYMVFEGADVDFTCEAYNKYGWGMARSQDLGNWVVLPDSPLGQSKGGCGQDMPSLFVRFDGNVFVFHTSADTTHVIREHLAWKNP